MQDNIYKINNISLDQKKQRFSICHDHGIKIYDLEEFNAIDTSDNKKFKIGNVSQSQFLIKYNLIVFTGSQKNKDFPQNVLVFFDMKNKKIILEKKFDKVITNFKCVSNFIFLAFESSSLIIFSYDKEKNELEQKEEHKIENSSLFECWEENINDITHNLYLAIPYEKNINIFIYTINEWRFENKSKIQNPVNKIQNIFYIQKLNQIFISDEKAMYIYGFDVINPQKKICLYRGKNPGVITSIVLLNNGKHLAINNLNRTIHIFDLDINNNSFSFSNLIYGIYDIEEIYPMLRIYYKDILKKGEGEYFKNDFAEKGALLYSNNNDDELSIIAYNGIAFKVKINFKEKKYNIKSKVEYIDKKVIKKDISLFTSGCDFEEEEK